MPNKISIAFSLSIIILAVLSASCSSNGNWRPPESVVGTWSGKSEVSAPFKKGQYPSQNPEDWFDIRVQIHEDGIADGQIGDVVFAGARIRKNRGWLGRMLHIKTDYMISGGVLEGKLVPEDSESRRAFTIPFDIEEGRLKGSFFVVGKLKYPDPLFPRLVLEKVH
jgi:hypothetical protein